MNGSGFVWFAIYRELLRRYNVMEREQGWEPSDPNIDEQARNALAEATNCTFWSAL